MENIREEEKEKIKDEEEERSEEKEEDMIGRRTRKRCSMMKTKRWVGRKRRG